MKVIVCDSVLFEETKKDKFGPSIYSVRLKIIYSTHKIYRETTWLDWTFADTAISEGYQIIINGFKKFQISQYTNNKEERDIYLFNQRIKRKLNKIKIKERRGRDENGKSNFRKRKG